MTNQHSLTPPPELVQQWMYESNHNDPIIPQLAAFAALAAQWGADQELEACLLCLQNNDYEKIAQCLHDDRRLKPPSLKEQALELAKPAGTAGAYVTFGPEELDTIRRALEQLND
jgi:hypothetical protein